MVTLEKSNVWVPVLTVTSKGKLNWEPVEDVIVSYPHTIISRGIS